MIEVKVRKNEPIDIAIKRLRGKVEREQLMDTLKSNWSFAPVTTNNPVK